MTIRVLCTLLQKTSRLQVGAIEDREWRGTVDRVLRPLLRRPRACT